MNENERYEKLNDYIDGELPDAEARALEVELERDAVLREEERALRALLGEAKRLPKGVVPRCDLWQCIESRLCARVCSRTGSSRRVIRLMYRAALAVAAAAVVFMAGVWYSRLGPKVAPVPVAVVKPAGSQSPEMAPASYRHIRLEYAGVRESLREKLDEARPNLAPETVKVVDDSLVTIDHAIQEIENALAKDPGNHGLIRSLIAAYDQEVGLLRLVAGIADGRGGASA